MSALPELVERACPHCGQTYELPWLITDHGDGTITAEQLALDSQVHDCNDRPQRLRLVLDE